MSNNNDTRSPITDALETLGLIHFKPEKRDAIHLAVEPVKANEDLKPGQRIGIVWDTYGVAWAIPAGTDYAAGYQDEHGMPVIKQAPYHGIVDPFLLNGPKEGESFWFVMRPREVRSLRHCWSHPDFPEET